MILKFSEQITVFIWFFSDKYRYKRYRWYVDVVGLMPAYAFYKVKNNY